MPAANSSPPKRRSKARIERRAEARVCKSIASPQHRGPRLLGIASHWRPAKHSHWSSDADGIEKLDRIFLGHADTAVRRGIAWQIAGVHSICATEAHEVVHWRRNEFPSRRNAHVRIGIGHDCVSARIDNFPVHARVMTSFLLENFECTSLGEMSVTATRNWRRQNRATVLKQISGLFL